MSVMWRGLVCYLGSEIRRIFKINASGISVEISVFGMHGSGTDAERAVGLLPLLEIGLNSKIYVFPART
jgi:hypothetical protein